MPHNTQKTKGEMLVELESIKSLLIAEDEIPILQEIEQYTPNYSQVPSGVPGGVQTSLFENISDSSQSQDQTPETHAKPSLRDIPKALGENPFLPQHIRARLHGNNPPPIFDYSPVKSHSNSTEIENRHELINRLIKQFLPQIEQELRLKLLTMTEDELKKL